MSLRNTPASQAEWESKHILQAIPMAGRWLLWERAR